MNLGQKSKSFKGAILLRNKDWAERAVDIKPTMCMYSVHVAQICKVAPPYLLFIASLYTKIQYNPGVNSVELLQVYSSCCFRGRNPHL